MRALGAIVCALALLACAHNRKIDLAKRSLYDTDFAAVYAAAFEVTRSHYPNLDDRPGPGRIITAWHEVKLASGNEDIATQRSMASTSTTATSADSSTGTGTSGANTDTGALGGSAPMGMKRYFIRFDVSVIGGRPWRVKVVGHAAEWEAGAALPVELHGIARPPWLGPRTEALEVAIYERLGRYAVRAPEERHDTLEDKLPKANPAAFRNVPAGAAHVLADIRVALGRRDYLKLRALIADDVMWSGGGGSGADAALAIWQADPTVFDAMADALGSCVADRDTRVVCVIPDRTVTNRHELVVELRGASWLATSFVPLADVAR